MSYWAKRVAAGVLALVGVAAVGIAILTARTTLPGEAMTPAGIRQSTSVYVTMHDGVEIAVTVWLPPSLTAGERVPVLMRTTRYWRGEQVGWIVRALVALHQAEPQDLEDRQQAYFNERGFAVMVVDARGNGASGGYRPVEYAPAEVADMGEVASWAARQPWSNGRVGTFGVSYDGNMAELAAVTHQPAIRALMPLYDDFDTQALIQPGGVPLRWFVQQWSDLVAALDRNDVCGVAGVHGWNCWKTRQLTPGVQPVDADPHGTHLAELVRGHHNNDVAKTIGTTEYRDDSLRTPAGTLRFADISVYGLRTRIEASGLTGDGAIYAYLEDVSPAGAVTYVDEGVFRVVHRKEVDPRTLPYTPLGPAHSFLRRDAEPLVPGEPATIRFALLPTSIVLRKGHRIRVALAGADASLFQRFPADGTPAWTVCREPQRASFVELPERRPAS